MIAQIHSNQKISPHHSRSLAKRAKTTAKRRSTQNKSPLSWRKLNLKVIFIVNKHSAASASSMYSSLKDFQLKDEEDGWGLPRADQLKTSNSWHPTTIPIAFIMHISMPPPHGPCPLNKFSGNVLALTCAMISWNVLPGRATGKRKGEEVVPVVTEVPGFWKCHLGIKSRIDSWTGSRSSAKKPKISHWNHIRIYKYNRRLYSTLRAYASWVFQKCPFFGGSTPLTSISMVKNNFFVTNERGRNRFHQFEFPENRIRGRIMCSYITHAILCLIIFFIFIGESWEMYRMIIRKTLEGYGKRMESHHSLPSTV